MDERSDSYSAIWPARPWHALYLAGVIGLACFLLLSVLFPEPIEGYRAETQIEQSASGEVLDAPLITQSQAEEIAQGVNDAAPINSRSTSMSGTVKCIVERPTPSQVRIIVRAFDRYAADSLDRCERIASEIVESQPTSFIPGLLELQSQRNNTQQRWLLARESITALEDQLTSLQRDHLREFSLALQQAVAVQSSEKSTPVPDIAPGYEKLAGEMRLLLQKREQLLGNRTENHPEVLDLDERLSVIRRQMQAIPNAVVARNVSSESSAAVRNAIARLETLQNEFDRRWRELSESLSAARRREQELSGESARLAAQPAPIAISTRVIRKPELVERIGGRPSTTRLACFSFLALGCGVLTFIAVGYVQRWQTLATTRDVQRQLRLPVVSCLGSHAVAKNTSFERIARRSVLTAELVLIGLVLAIFGLLCLPARLAEPARQDPFGAMAESLDQTLSGKWRR